MNSNRLGHAAVFIVVLIFAALFCAIFVGKFDDREASMHALKSSGMRNPILGKHVNSGCGRGDFSSIEFSELNSNGEMVGGVVCCGLIGKRCTVRF